MLLKTKASVQWPTWPQFRDDEERSRIFADSLLSWSDAFTTYSYL